MIFTPLYVIIEITPDIGRKSAMHEKVIDFLNSNETKQTFPGINGSYRMFDKSSIVGYCHCTTHKGVLDISDMNRHDCIKKSCFHFEKYEQFPYWEKKKRAAEAMKIKKTAIKAKQLKRQKAADEHNSELEKIRTEAQTISSGLGYNIGIIKTEKISPKAYVIFYVSDKSYNDWYIYQELSVSLYHTYGSFFELRHIKTVDGKYAVFEDVPAQALRKLV